MDENDYKTSFELILVAGDSKTESMMAITAARNGDLVKAEEHLKVANEKLIEAHAIQTNMIQQEAMGNSVPINVILVHSQDHLTMAIVTRDLAEEIVKLYEVIHEFKKADIA